jgi:ectoine hydroxylase-related dioxygenase (phytanoyl-CoA dioxygenase family)
MAPKIARFAYDAPRARIGDALLEDGAVIVEGALSKEMLTEFNQEIDGLIKEQEAQDRLYSNSTITAFFGSNTGQVASLASRSAVFRREVLCHELNIAMCDRVLLPNCARYQLNFSNVMLRGPGAKAQPLHRDDGIYIHMPKPPGFHLEVASMVALGEFSADMGATLIAPGSHRWEPDRQAQPEDLVVAEMEPGSTAFYIGSVIHAGGANRTADKWRRGMHLSYCLGWLRAQENIFLSTPMEIVRSLPREQQALLGYAIHDAIAVMGGFVNAVDWRDPLDLIAEGRL